MSEKVSNKKRFIGNTGWMMGQRIYSMFLSLVVGALSARYLGPANYGLLNYGATIISLFTTISSLGLTNVIINEMVVEPKKNGSYLGSALCARLITSFISLFIIWGIVVALEPNNKLLQTVTMLQAFSVIFQSYEVFTYWFQVKLKMKVVSIATMLALTAVAIWKISLLATSKSVEWFALSNSINYLVAGAVVVIIFVRSSKIKLTVNLDDTKMLLGKSYHFIISGIAVVLYSQIDRVMIGKMLDEKELGFYAAAMTVACLWEFIPTALTNSARPLIIEKRDTDYKEYEKRFQILLLGITLMGIAIGLAFTLLGKLAILILYGREYMQAQWPLAILIWATSMAMIGNVRSIWIVSEGLNKYVKHFTIEGAIFNIITNLWFIPHMGIIGASLTTLMSQFVVCFIAPLFVPNTRRFVKLYLGSFKYLPELMCEVKKLLVKKRGK